MKNELFHHGVKGQKWGVKNGPPYPLTRITKGSEEASNEIYKTLSKREKNLIMGESPNDGTPPRKFIRKGEAKYLVDQILVKYGDTPVAALDVWNQGHGEAAVSIMTRNDPKYRGKGYADMAAKEVGKRFVEKYKDINVLEWGAWDVNEPSKHLAEKNGFKFKDWHDPGGEKYVVYEKRKK